MKDQSVFVSVLRHMLKGGITQSQLILNLLKKIQVCEPKVQIEQTDALRAWLPPEVCFESGLEFTGNVVQRPIVYESAATYCGRGR